MKSFFYSRKLSCENSQKRAEAKIECENAIKIKEGNWEIKNITTDLLICIAHDSFYL
jgi:hypothetical protein